MHNNLLNDDIHISPLMTAVNEVLASSGLAPVYSLDELTSESGSDTAKAALQAINSVRLDVLSFGVNDKMDVVCLRKNELDNKIYVPRYALFCTPINFKHIIVRNGCLYDRVKDTYDVGNSIECYVKWDADFNSLQPYVQRYITHQASLDFATKYYPDPQAISMLYDKARKAKSAFRQAENNAEKANLFTNKIVIEAHDNYRGM